MAATAWTTAPAPVLDFLGDERLARLAARGDQRAFGALFTRHQAGVTRYCRGILRNDADGEDAAQNAMVAALRALEGGTVPMRVKPWLYRIAHNEAISLARRRRTDVELDEMQLPGVGDAEEVSAVRERLGQLMTDLQSLSERQRQALVLRELYDFSYAEIAATLGSTEAAAQQTVFEARSSLQHFDEGRAMACEGVQRAMSACDGMRLRTRVVRAHVRDCSACKEFETALRARRRDLGLLFPPVGGAGGVFALLARLVGAGGGEPLVAGFGLKGVAVGLAVLAGGGAVVGVTAGSGGGSGAALSARPVAAGATPAASGAAPSAGAAGSGHRAGQPTGPGKAGHAKHAAGKHGVTAGKGAGDGSAGAPGATSAGDSGGSDGGVSHVSDSSGADSSAPGGGSDPTSSLPVHAHAPSPVQQAAGNVTNAASGAVTNAGQAVKDTAQQVTDTASGAVDTVTDATQSVTDTASGATGTVTDAVGDVTQNLPHLP
jgi:RNA polymerase sigma factor (sigma-70 family)